MNNKRYYINIVTASGERKRISADLNPDKGLENEAKKLLRGMSYEEREGRLVSVGLKLNTGQEGLGNPKYYK